MKLSREEAADNLERIECDGAGVVYLEADDIEAFRMGAEALRVLSFCERDFPKLHAAIILLFHGKDELTPGEHDEA